MIMTNINRVGYAGLETPPTSPSRPLGSTSHEIPRVPPGSPTYLDYPTRPPQSPMRTHSASPRPPSSARTRSRPNSRYRLRAASLDLDAASQVHIPSPPPSRPPSSFARHPALPPIGTKIAHLNDITDKVRDIDLNSNPQNVERQKTMEPSSHGAKNIHDPHHVTLPPSSNNLVTQSHQSFELPSEPSESEERILLAIKLSDGKRLQRFFRKSEPLCLILQFASLECSKDLLDCKLVDNATRTTYNDTSIKIGDAGLFDRTVLYIEIPDD